MSDENKIAGVVLAGGLSRRMQQEKGLVLLQQRPLISFALTTLATVAAPVFISANRHHAAYQQFGYPLIADLTQDFDGPLAGILAAMRQVQTPNLLVIPCDSPLVRPEHLQRLLIAQSQQHADIATVIVEARLHPLFLALKTELADDLAVYLNQGGRKVQDWLQRHALITVDFSNEAEAFVNINTPEDLQRVNRLCPAPPSF